MTDLLDGEERYYPKPNHPGSGIEITNVRITAKGSVYSTNYIASIRKDQSKKRKRWEILWSIVAVMFALLFGRDLIEQEVNLLWAILGILFGIYAYFLYKTDVQTYFIQVKMTMGDEISLSFKEDKDRDEAFQALSKALAFWRIHQTPIETETRMERFHS